MKNKIKNKGFTLLLSVLVTSIILSVGLGIFNIMTKELKLSGMGRESQIAFYAADAGIECFFFWEIKHPNLSDTAFNAPNTINCAGNSVANNFSGNASNFTVPLSNNSCAKIKVTKSGLVTTVESRGYNTACDSTSPFKVERAIQLVSTRQEGGGVYAPPNPPTNITVNSNSFHKVNVSWNNSIGADSYTVYRSEDNKSFEIAVSGITGQNYTDGGLNKNTDYYYYVTAIGAYGESDQSEIDNAKTNDTQEEIFTSNINWPVPSGVQEVLISTYGAQGGGGDGGKGGYTKAIFNVNPSDNLYINVGGAGAVSGSCGNGLKSIGGFNGGGDSGRTDTSGGCPGTGGGGASDVRKGSNSLSNRIIVSGGGGGGGGSGASGGGKGGAGGGTDGSNAVNNTQSDSGGKKGVLPGGAGGAGNHNGNLGNNGSTGVGGVGGSNNFDAGGTGGGGGGGYYGGGGGGGGGDCNGSCASYGGGGGGGGGNYISNTGLYTENQNGLNSGNGQVIIEY